MPETSVHDQLVELMALSDDLIEHFTKEQMVETARLLAANLAQYQRHFGMLPANPSLNTVTPGTVTEDQELFIVESLENLISVLGAVKSIEQAGDVGHETEPWSQLPDFIKLNCASQDLVGMRDAAYARIDKIAPVQLAIGHGLEQGNVST